MTSPTPVYSLASLTACSPATSYNEGLGGLKGSFENLNSLFMSGPREAPAPAGSGRGVYAQLCRPGTFPVPHRHNPTDVARHTHDLPVSMRAPGRRPRLSSVENVAVPPAEIRPQPKPKSAAVPASPCKKAKKPTPIYSVRVKSSVHTPVRVRLGSQPVEEGLVVLSMSSDNAAPLAPMISTTAPITPAVVASTSAPIPAAVPAVPPAAAAAAPSPAATSVRAEVLSGAAAGAAVSGLLFPLNTVKTRLMAGAPLLGEGALSGLWAGARFDMAAQACSTAVFFGAYGRLKRRFAGPDGELDTLGSLKAGAGAALAASLLAVPSEVVRQHVQARQFASPRAALAGILSARGPRGLYAGYGGALVRDLPFDTVQIMLYEGLRRGYLAATRRADDHLNAGETAGLGGAAGALAGFVTAPVDCVRTHAVLSGAAAGQAPLSLRAAAGDLLRKQGVRGLFRGAGARSLEIAIGGMVFFTVLEHVQKMLTPTAAANVTDAPAPAAQLEPEGEMLYAFA